ncbi:hypothetical protein ACWGOQ_0007560 [Aquimarina sp. M1]
MILISLGILSFVLVGSSESVALRGIQVTMLWGILVYLLPLLILFFNYRKKNRNISLKIENHNIHYYNNKENLNSFTFRVESIDKVVFNQSFPLYYNNVRLFFWDEYYYALVRLKNGEKIVVTCLLCDEFEKFIPSHLIVEKRRLFPLIDLSSSSSSIRQGKENNNNERINALMSKFKSKSQEELENIILNEGSYQKEAVQAARNLLKSRSLQN